MTDCKQCPCIVGDTFERDCDFPDCMGGWEEVYKDLQAKLKTFEQSHADYERKLDEAIKVIEFYADRGDEHFIGNHAQTFLKSLESDND